MKIVFLFAIIFLSMPASAEIYKWVDENGVTHFGGKKPLQLKVKAEQVTLKQNQESKKLTGEAKVMADSLATSLMKDHGDAKKLNCEAAVNNAKDGIDTMLSVGERNYNSGYMSRADYNKTKKELKSRLRRISVPACSSASGKAKGFYKCMTNDYNHVAHCGKKYNF